MTRSNDITHGFDSESEQEYLDRLREADGEPPEGAYGEFSYELPVNLDCDHANAERLSVCCGREELGDESDICGHPQCRDHTGFEMVCDCGAVLPDPRYAK